MKHRSITAAAGAILAAALFLSACSFSTTGQKSVVTTPTAIPAVRDDRVQVEGRLAPVQTLSLAFLASGRIKDLNVAEGSQVQANDVIARLDGAEQLQANLDAAKLELLSAQQDIDSLNDNYGIALATAQKVLAQAKIDLKKAQDDRNSMVYRRASDTTLNGLRADLIMAQKNLETAQDFYNHHSSGDDLITAQALSKLAAAQKARDRAEYNLNYASELPDKNEIDKADANLAMAKANVEQARVDLDRLSSGPDAKTLALANARLQKDQTSIKAIQTALSNLELKAPISGTIVNLGISQGEEVTPGVSIATLADFSRWVVETNDLTELQVVRLAPGQKAELVADALPGETLSGTIERISNKFIEKQGDITYTVRILLNESDPRLRWGMTFAVRFDTTTQGDLPSQAQPVATLAPTTEGQAAPTATPVDSSSQATAALKSYFAALEAKDTQGASNLLSLYGLSAEDITRGAAASLLQNQMAAGAGWSALEIKEQKAQDDTTVLFHVQYKLAAKDAKTGQQSESQPDEWWPVRNENGQWLVNWNRVVEFRSLDIAGQTMAGLTMHPVRIIRYPDRVRLVLFVQNRTNDPIVLGQPNEILATFYFGGEKAEGEQTRLIFDRQKTYPAAAIEVKGSYTSFPDKVEIRKWKNYQVAPWYTFALVP